MSSPFSILLIAATCAAGAPNLLAAVPQQDVTDFARTTSALTSTQRKALDAFIEYGITGLKSDVPLKVTEAREALIQPLIRVGTSPVFREAFGETFIDKARPILEGSRPFNAHNAYLVLAFVRTGEAIEYLSRRIEPSANSNNAQRIAASSMLVLALRTTPPDLIRPRQLNSIIRSIVTGAEKEASWVVLQHNFEALIEIGSNSKIPDEIRAKAIAQEATVLKTTLDRIARGDSTQLARAVSPIVLMLRSQFISLGGSIRRDFASHIQPALVKVIDAGERGWRNIRSNATLAKSYGDAIYQATVLARLVAGSTEAPASDPADYWRQGDRSRYSQTVQEWMQLGH